MKKLTLFLTLLFGIVIISCSNDDDNKISTSEFQGNWSGIYTGNDDNGNWNMNIDENGVITGTVTSNIFNFTTETNGNVQENGNLEVTVGASNNGATFQGTMNVDENTAGGTWENGTFNGTWNGSRQ